MLNQSQGGMCISGVMRGSVRVVQEGISPVDKHSCSYTVCRDAFKRLARDFSPTEHADLFHNTAARMYHLREVQENQPGFTWELFTWLRKRSVAIRTPPPPHNEKPEQVIYSFIFVPQLDFPSLR